MTRDRAFFFSPKRRKKTLNTKTLNGPERQFTRCATSLWPFVFKDHSSSLRIRARRIMGFRSAVAGVAKNIVLGAPSALKTHHHDAHHHHQRGGNGHATDEEDNAFESEDEEEARRCTELLEHLSNAILPEDTLDVLNQLRDCVRESRTSQMVAAKVGGVDVIFECLLEEMHERGEKEEETSERAHAALEVLVAAMTTEHEEDLKIVKEREILEEKERGKMMTGKQRIGKERRTASEMNREALAAKSANVFSMLQMISSNDFYVKYHATQILCAMSSRRNTRKKVQEEIVKSPGASEVLVNSCSPRKEKSEVLRNETLLLLARCTKGHSEIQKLVAFEGMFEVAFDIIRAESSGDDAGYAGESVSNGLDGGIVVQDCLELCNNLIRGNALAQSLFRENGCVGKLVQFFKGLERRIGSDVAAAAYPAQKAANALCALESVSLLVGAVNLPEEEDSEFSQDAEAREIILSNLEDNRDTNRGELAARGGIEALCTCALGNGKVESAAIRVAALRALRDAVDYHDANQARLFSAEVTREARKGSGVPEPALLALGRTALKAETKAEREAALMALESAVRGNTDGQILLVSTLAPTGLGGFDDGQNENENDGGDDDFAGETSLGGLFARAMLRATSTSSSSSSAGRFISEDEKKQQFIESYASTIALKAMLEDNEDAKMRALRVNLQPLSEMGSAKSAELLLPRCVRSLAIAQKMDDANGSLQSAILRLLIAWLSDCALAVHSFVTSDASHLPTLSDLAKYSSLEDVRTLACVCLGCCLAYYGEQDYAIASNVLDVVARRIGTNDFLAAIEHATRTDNFKRALLPPKPPPTVTRATAASLLAESTSSPNGGHDQKTGTTSNKDFNPYDYSTAHFIQRFEPEVRRAIVRLYGGDSTKDSNASGMGGMNGMQTSPFDRQEGEDAESYAKRLKSTCEQLDNELRVVRQRNKTLAETVANTRAHAEAPATIAVAAPPASQVVVGPSPSLAPPPSPSVQQQQQHQDDPRIAQLEREIKLKSNIIREKTEELKSLASAYQAVENQFTEAEEELQSLRKARSENQSDAETTAQLLENAKKAGIAQGLRDAESEFSSREDATRARLDLEKAEALKDLQEEMDDLLEVLGMEEKQKEFLFRTLVEKGEDMDTLEEKLEQLTANIEADEGDEDEE